MLAKVGRRMEELKEELKDRKSGGRKAGEMPKLKEVKNPQVRVRVKASEEKGK